MAKDTVSSLNPTQLREKLKEQRRQARKQREEIESLEKTLDKSEFEFKKLISDSGALSISKRDGKYIVRFPYDLLDQFKPYFPSAKWDRYEKVWIVGPRGGKRLRAWFEVVKDVADTIADANEKSVEAELSKIEIEEIKKEAIKKVIEADGLIKVAIEREEDEVETIEEKLVDLEDTLDMLKRDREKFEKIAKKKKEMEEKEEKLKKEIDEFLDQFLDREEINAAIEKMKYWHGKVGHVAHEKFDEAKAVILKYDDLLEEAGYKLQALRYLVNANFNRPDRDAVSLMPAGAWYKLEKIEGDE